MKTRNKFKKGNKAALGNKGGGRPPDWLKEKCQSIVVKSKLVEFLKFVALSESAETKDRMKAVEMLLDRGWGKANQTIEGTVTHKVFEFTCRKEHKPL